MSYGPFHLLFSCFSLYIKVPIVLCFLKHLKGEGKILSKSSPVAKALKFINLDWCLYLASCFPTLKPYTRPHFSLDQFPITEILGDSCSNYSLKYGNHFLN